MLNFLRIFRHKNLLKIAVLAALIGFGNSLWSENYIWNEKAKSNILGPYTWSSQVGGGNTDSIWKKESPGGSWEYLTSTPEMTLSDNILFSGECTVIVQLEKDISVDKIIMAYEQGDSYPVTSGAYPVTIDLNGYNLTCNDLILNNNGNFPVNLTITDSNATKGNFIIKNGFDFSDNQTHTINITQGANLKIEGTITGATSGTGSVTIDSSDHTGKLEVTGNVENNGKGFNTNAENLDVTIWTGAKDTVWEDDANWSTGTVPAETAEVAIPDGLTNYPTIAAGKNIVVKSLAMGDSAKITVEGTLSINSDFTLNNRITGSGSLIVPSGKTYTVPAITVGVGIVNNGTVDCGTNKVVFAKDLANGSSGKFYVASEPGTTTFKGNTDFSAGTLGISGLYGSEPGTINFYNPITSETDPVKTLKTPSTQLSINNFNFGGKINIELGAKITTKQLNMDALGVTENFSSKDFIVNISGGEIECTSMNITRASATNDVIGTLNLSTNVKCTGTIQTHSGTNLNNTNGYNFEATTFDHSADNSTPYTKLSVNGTFTVTDFVIQSNNGSTEVEISSTGKLIANKINVNNNKTFKKATKADGSEWSGATGYSITNNGTIQVGTSLNLPASFIIKNDGIIKDKDSSTGGATYTFAGTYDNSSTGTLIVDGGSVTNTAAEITINNLTLKNSNTINGTQKIKVTNATYTDSTNLAIIGTVELPGVTNGNVTIGNVNTEGTTTFTSSYQLDTLTITNGTLTPAASSTNKINTRLTNNGTYTDSTGCTLQLADDAIIDGTPASGSNNLPNLTVECLGSATFDCSNIINTLKAKSLGGKTLTFATDTFQTVTNLYLSGSSTTDTLSLTGIGIWKINIDDPNNASVKWVTIENSTANQSSIKQIFAKESFDNGNNKNWDFAITYKWTGAKDTAWDDAANWTPKNYGYPGSTTTAHNVLIPDGLAAEKYPEYTNITNKIKTLKIGESDGSAATLTLNANNLQVDDEDAGTADLSNYGTIIFTNAGRITDSSTTPVPIMDNAKGTVEYSTGTTCNITDYHNGTNGTADYYNLVIKSGRWTIPASATGSNNNIKAANSFTIKSGATLIMENTSEVNSSFTNNGTIEIKEGTSENPTSVGFWGNFTNSSTGKVKQNNYTKIWISGSCETVDDYGTWTFGTDADISFNMFPANSSFNVKSAAAATNNKYNLFIPYNAEHNITFKGFDSSNPMKIAKWTDTGVTSESLSFNFQNVDFLDNGTGFTFNSNITASSGNLTFSDDTTFVKKTTFETSGTITVETEKTITAQKDFEVTNGTVDLKGSITTTDVALKLNTVQVSHNASLSAKKITITGSIEPKTAADSSLWNLSLNTTGSSDDDTISVGSDTGAEISIGTADKLFKDITLTTTNQNITFGENCKLHAAGTISAIGKNVTFNNSIISNALVVNATEEVSLNGLNAKSFTVTGTTTTPTAVKYAGLIKLYGTSDFIIDYPAITTDNAEFELGGNFVLQDKTTPYRREGSIVPDVDYNSATPRTLKITTPPNSEIQLHKNVGSIDYKFTSVNFYSPVNFAVDGLTLYAETSNFAEDSSLKSTNKFAISKHLEIGGIFTYAVDEQFNIPGNCTIDSTGISTFAKGVAVCGSFTDNGKWKTDADKGTITFIGSDAATFKASENSKYNIVLNNSYKELTFINSKANVTKLTVTNAAALKFQCDADIGTFSNTADSLKLEIGYIDASNSSNNKSAKVTINNLDGNTLNSKTVVINSELDFKQTSEGVTLGSNDPEITIAGSITAAHDITLLGTITSVEVDDASKETLPKITAGTGFAINFGSTTSDQVTYSGTNLYLNSPVNNKAEFINSGTLTANQSFTNNDNAQFINSGTLTANQSFTNYGSATGTSSSAILNLKKDFTDNGKWESEETLVINGTGTQNFTLQSTGSTYNKILIQKTAAATDDEVIFTAGNTLKAKTVTIENNDTTNFNGPVSIGTLNDVAASSEAPGSITINGGGTISTATLNTTGDLTVTSDAGLTITNLTHTTGETKVNGKLTLTEDSTVGKITIAKTDGKLQGASGKTITVLGHWTNNGTFTANAGIVTFDGTLTIAGRSEFNTANMAGTISITSANQYATLNIYNSSSTNNSDPANPVTKITPSQITFPAGPTNVQTVTTALFLKGNSAEKLLQLKSSSSTPITDTTEADCFYINFTGTITDTDESKNPDIQFVEMTNGYNASGDGTTHNYITTYNSIDNGNNYYWNFNGCTYTWTGKHSTAYTDWFNRANWDRNSVPGINVNIKINKEYTIGGITTAVENNHWPLLAADATRNISGNLELGETGTLTIGPDAQLDIATYNINAATNTASITNNGLIRIRGVTGQKIAGTMNNGSGSTIEYYDAPASQIVSLPWDGEGTTATAGKQYANLLVSGILNVPSDDITCSENAEFTNDIKIKSISVTGTTDFTKASAQTLTGNATFNGDVTSVSNLELNGAVTIATTLPVDAAVGSIPTLSITAPLITFDRTVDSSDKTQVLEITGNAIFHDKVGATNELASLSVSGTTTIDTSEIKTTGTQTYTGAVTIDTTLPAGAAAGSVPTATLTASTVTFSSTVDGNDEDEALTVSGNAVFNADVAATKKLASLGIAGTTELTSSISFNCDTTFGNSILGTTHTVTLNNGPFTINDSTDDDTSVTVEPIVINNATLTAGNNVVFQNKVQNDGTLNCNDGNVIFQEVYLPTKANTFNAGTGTVTFNKDITFTNTTFAHNNGTLVLDPTGTNLTVHGSGSQEYNIVQIKGSVTFDSANTFNELTAADLENKTITFPAGESNIQTINSTLKLTGKANENNKRLILKSSSANSNTAADCFYINYKGTITETTPYQPLIQYVDMINGYNKTEDTSSNPVFLTCRNSEDSGNNYYWNFPGLIYIWTGATDTDWFVRTNWNRKSVPGKDSNISINEKVNEVSVTNWPDLDNSTYPNGVSKVDMGQGEIEIGQKAELHINTKDLKAEKITNSGLVKIKGTNAAQTITGTRVNETGSTVEYYSGTTATPTINFAWENKYANLLITDVTNNSSDLEISEELIIHNNTALSGKLAVTGTTTIETTENVSLTGSNNLAGGVEIKKVNDAVLNNNGTFNLTQTAGADINTLTINSPVTLKTNVITTSSQTYNGEITLIQNTELTVSNSTPADLLTINNKLSGSTYALAIDANTSFTSEEKVTAGYIKSAGTKDRTWTSTTKANLDSDLYIDCDTNKIIFDGNFTANNIYMYNGAVTVKSGKTLEALHNLAVWGAAYSATDKRYSANNTRFEYYTAPAFSFAYTQDSRTTTFDSLAGSTIKVCNNFYLNGTDLPSVTLDLPANTSSKPELNTTAAVTEKQWGLPYAAIFNSAITGVTANTGYVTAAVEQGNTDKGGNNQNLQFEIPQIAQAYTVYDDVIYVEFTLPVENAHNEINTNLRAGATAESNGELSKGGLWYNNKEYRFHPVAYTDKDCTTELEASSEGVTSFYLKTIHTETNTAASYWNTDADGEYAYNQIATNPLESTDRNGIHHDITVDLSMLEGMFTSAKGHTMSSNYGINFEADGFTEAERFTATQDKCSPVLLAVYTGQENHIADSDIQPDYDAHNFVEFLYSEPVDIGNETTALKAEDGENNIQASATLGGITGAGVGTGITPATGKGLTIAGLAAFTDGRLNSGNKLNSSSPHSLYRNFSTSVSQSAKKQTNRIRVSIAGYVDGTIDGTHKNWIGYIDYSEMPANGSTVRAIENAYLTDTNGNSIDVKGTQTNHKIATEFKINQGAKNETLNAIYGSWDTSAPVFSQIRKIRNDYADEYEIVPTGNGSVIDKLEFHILDNEENGNNTYFVFTHGWSQMLDAPDAEGYRYSLKPGFQAADKFGGSRAFANGDARTGGGIRYSSYYNMQSAFKFGIHSDAEPVYNFKAITPGATSSYFTGSSNDAYPIPSTDDNNYISLEISGSSYSYEVQFSISYDNTNAYITDLAGNRLQNALMSSIDRTPPDFDITLAPVGGNTHGNGELYIVFVKKLKLENISVGSYTHEKLVDVLPSIVQFGTINSSFTEDTSLKVESAQVYEPLTVTGTHKGDKEFTAFKLTLNRAVTLDDIKTKYIRIAFPASEGEYSLDPFTLAAGARVTYIQDFDGISYLQMYKAHPLSDFAINVINPEYAYDPDYTGDNAASMMRSPDDENGSWAVHDWSKDQKNFGTLPYGGQINLITNTTSDGDSDDSNDAGVPATQSFTLYLSKAPTAESVSTHFNNDFDTNKRIWLPQVAGTPAFEPLSDALNENFETVLHTAAPDFDEEKYPNRIQFNFNQKDYDWNSGDQIQFLFGLNGTSIMHNPDNTNDGSSYTGISSPIYALRTSNILNPDIQTLDLWSFKLKDVKTQRGGVSIYNNVINVLKGERTTIKISMPRKGNLKVIVMTLDGNVISYLENSNNVSGDHIYTWNGTNKKGNMVARGLYFIRVIGEGIDETRKVMCINEK